MIQEISKSPRRKIFRAKTKRTDQRSAYRTGENTQWRRPRKRLDNISGEYPRCHHSAVEDFFQEGILLNCSSRKDVQKQVIVQSYVPECN